MFRHLVETGVAEFCDLRRRGWVWQRAQSQLELAPVIDVDVDLQWSSAHLDGAVLTQPSIEATWTLLLCLRLGLQFMRTVVWMTVDVITG